MRRISGVVGHLLFGWPDPIWHPFYIAQGNHIVLEIGAYLSTLFGAWQPKRKLETMPF